MLKPRARKAPCFCCGKFLKTEFRTVGKEWSGVIQGIVVRTDGGYGSQVLDLGGWMYFAICDECLVKRSDRAIMVGARDPKKKNDVISARDYYDEWFAQISSASPIKDDYFQDVLPYFKEKKDGEGT